MLARRDFLTFFLEVVVSRRASLNPPVRCPPRSITGIEAILRASDRTYLVVRLEAHVNSGPTGSRLRRQLGDRGRRVVHHEAVGLTFGGERFTRGFDGLSLATILGIVGSVGHPGVSSVISRVEFVLQQLPGGFVLAAMAVGSS